MLLALDRIENGIAVCIDEHQRQHNIELSKLPNGVREGDMLLKTEDGYKIDASATEFRRKTIADRLSRQGAASRRRSLTRLLEQADEPISASSLAERFSVTRQVIVGDIALLRASGAPVLATPRGYVMESALVGKDSSRDYTIACRHKTIEQLIKELYIVVDQGATVRDVMIEHPVFGQLTGQLQISSRFDADRFVNTLYEAEASPLSFLTGGIHLHTLRCPDADCFERIKAQLKEANILVSE